MINYYNLKRLDKKNHIKIINKIKKTIFKGDYILGKEVTVFEKEFSKLVGAKYGIGCGNGTDAITLALKSLNLPLNSEVIIPAMTYCSTAFAIINAGLKPVLVDIEKQKSTIDITKLKKKITLKTRVIMPVHLYGSAVDLNKIKKIISTFKRKIFIVDDCAQAHGAFIGNKRNNLVGSSSDISCFSLYPAKNLGAYGDAGIITTNSQMFYNTIKNLRNLGSDKKFVHDQIGFNSRLDTIQACILNVKIKSLKNQNIKRKKIAKIYDKEISNNKIYKLKYSEGCVYHQYIILTKNRTKLIKVLKRNKIGFSFHYPYAIHQLQALKSVFNKQRFPNAEIIAKNSISLPIDPNLTIKEIKKIIKVLNNF